MSTRAHSAFDKVVAVIEADARAGIHHRRLDVAPRFYNALLREVLLREAMRKVPVTPTVEVPSKPRVLSVFTAHGEVGIYPLGAKP